MKPLAMEGKEKGELEEIIDKEFTLDTFSDTVNGEGEVLISFNVKEIPDKFFFASGTLKDFICDNITDNEDIVRLDGGYQFAPSDGIVSVTYEGKKQSKNKRMYNSWRVVVK